MIYFITAREIGRVKIGFSDEPRQRFVKMRTDSPVPLELERICDGGKADERALHDRFASARLQGEWFALIPEIEAHMQTLAVPAAKERARSLNQDMIEALGCSPGYASQLLAAPETIPLRVLVELASKTGHRIGRLAGVTDHELEVLVKYVGPWRNRRKAA